MKRKFLLALVSATAAFAVFLTGCSVTNVSKLGGSKALRNADDFSDGVAWAKLIDTDDSSTSETVLIDAEGKIIFRTENSIKTSSFKGGMGYYVEDGVYYIIDTSGKVIATSEDLGFEKVEAYDEGVMLLSKGGADGYKYGVIDKDGQWVYEMTTIRLPDSFKEKNLAGSTEIRASYVGDDVFAIYRYNSTTIVGGYKLEGLSADWVFFNWKTGDVFYLIDSYLTNVDYPISFHNSKAYIPFPLEMLGNQFAQTDLLKAPNMQEKTEIKSAFILTNTGDYEEIEDFFSFTTGVYTLTEYYDWVDDSQIFYTAYYNIKNTETGNTIEFRDYTCKQIKRINYSYGYGMIMFTGEDEKSYFTVLDDDGSMRFEPIAYISLAYSETNIVYKSSSGYNILDLDGNVLAEKLEYSYIGPVEDGLAAATDSEKNCCYIDVYGNVKIGQS